MKKLLLISLVAIGCNTSDKYEVGYNCNEVKDKRVTAHEYPYLYWEWELYIDYCGSMRWVEVQSDVYQRTNRGDCY